MWIIFSGVSYSQCYTRTQIQRGCTEGRCLASVLPGFFYGIPVCPCDNLMRQKFFPALAGTKTSREGTVGWSWPPWLCCSYFALQGQPRPKLPRLCLATQPGLSRSASELCSCSGQSASWGGEIWPRSLLSPASVPSG